MREGPDRGGQGSLDESLVPRRLRSHCPFASLRGRGGHTLRRALLLWRRDRWRVLRAGGVDPVPVGIVIAARRVVVGVVGWVVHRIGIGSRVDREEAPNPYVKGEPVPVVEMAEEVVVMRSMVKEMVVEAMPNSPLEATMESMRNSAMEPVSEPSASATVNSPHPCFSRREVRHRENHPEQSSRHADEPCWS